MGEDKGKVKNIVMPNVEKFRTLYSDVIRDHKALCTGADGIITQDLHPRTLDAHVARLPLNLRKRILNNMRDHQGSFDRDACRTATLDGLRAIIGRSSLSQTVKGIATAGFNKSMIYGLQKLTKMFKSMR